MTMNRSPDEPGRHSYGCLLRLPEVLTRVGLSRSEVYRRITDGTFPRPVKLGERASAWPEQEIEAWAAARIAERDGVAQ